MTMVSTSEDSLKVRATNFVTNILGLEAQKTTLLWPCDISVTVQNDIQEVLLACDKVAGLTRIDLKEASVVAGFGTHPDLPLQTFYAIEGVDEGVLEVINHAYHPILKFVQHRKTAKLHFNRAGERVVETLEKVVD